MPDTQKDLYKKLLGKRGEDLAVKFLKKQGYKLIKRNYVTPYGEADAVAEKGDELVFVEVKTRTNDLYGDPRDAVDARKRERYLKIAAYYLAENGERAVSFAVAEVTPDGVNLIEHAF